MQFLILNTAPPLQATDYSYQQLIAKLREQKHLIQTFFFQDGVLHAQQARIMPQDEPNPYLKWLELAEVGVELLVCTGAAERRGITISAPFRESGLSSFVMLYQRADKFIHFK